MDEVVFLFCVCYLFFSLSRVVVLVVLAIIVLFQKSLCRFPDSFTCMDVSYI